MNKFCCKILLFTSTDKCLLRIQNSSTVCLFNDFPVLESSNILLNKESLLILINSGQYSSSFAVAVNSLKSFIIDRTFLALETYFWYAHFTILLTSQ